jgi:hypothetical protein
VPCFNTNVTNTTTELRGEVNGILWGKNIDINEQMEKSSLGEKFLKKKYYN